MTIKVNNNITTDDLWLMERMVDHLQATGRKTKSPDLEERFGASGVTVRQIMNAARTLGFPICSSCKGYWYAKDDKDVYNTIAQLESRVRKINRAIEGLKARVS